MTLPTRRSSASDVMALAVILIATTTISACDRGGSVPDGEPKVAPVASTPVPAVPAQPEPGAPQPREENFVLPGRFAPDTTVADLQQRYGKANVRIGELPGAEGEVHRGVELFAGDPLRHAYVYFEDETALRGLSLVAIRDPQSNWTLGNGVHIGMSLSELVALNGAAVVFTGFGWDYGGYVSDWSSGKLADVDGDAVRTGVRLRTRATGADGAHDYPMGDAEFRSDDEAYPKLGERVEVGQITVSFPGEDDL